MPLGLRQFFRKSGNWLKREDAGMMDALITHLILWIFATTAVGFIAGMLWGVLNTDILSMQNILQNLF